MKLQVLILFVFVRVQLIALLLVCPYDGWATMLVACIWCWLIERW